MAVSRQILAVADRIDRLNAVIGRAAAWLVVFVVAVQFGVVLLRYGFGIGSIWLTESVLYAHAAMFMLAAAWTLREGGHVRVDVFYERASPRARAWIDLGGSLLLLLPLMLLLLWFAWPYVSRSWTIFERSREASGLPGVFLVKTLILLFSLLMLLQGVSQAIKSCAILSGKGER